MNTDQNAAVMNRLILLVLSLILVCLVLLVVRAYLQPGRVEPKALPASEIAAVPEELAPAEEPAAAPPPRPPARLSTNVVRAAPIFPRPSTPVAAPVSEPVGDGLVVVGGNPTIDFAGVGVSPGLGVGGGAVAAESDGEIYGITTLLGTPKPEIAINFGPSCGRLLRKSATTRHYVVDPAGRLANVLVYVSVGAPSVPAPANAAPPLLDQVGCMFEPYMIAVQTGQPFQIRNSDPELHNIHSTPRINPEFNFAQPVRGMVTVKSFARPETFIRIKCDVHPWMFAYVSVLDHPWFALTGTNGGFRLPRGLLAGRYTLTAAHHKSGSLSQQIDFRPGEPKAVEFQFNVPDATQAQRTGARPVR